MALGVVRSWRLTLLGRSLLLISGELLANAVCWVVAGILFGRHAETRGLLSLALLAWVRVRCTFDNEASGLMEAR